MGEAASETEAGAWAARRRSLREDGYCRAPGVLDAAALAATRRAAADALASVDEAHRARWRSEGSLIALADHPAFSALIANPAIGATFERLGLGGARFSSGYVISKPPGGPALFWHQDWWGWGHPISRSDRIFQVALFFYLTDTTPENGCLRVIPGSHRRAHPLHAVINAHDPALAAATDPDNPAFASHPDQVDVPVRAGDMVIADARLLHGAHPNRSAGERTNITLWWHPDYAGLPAEVRARLWRIFNREETDTDLAADRSLRHDSWPEPHRGRVLPLLVEDPGPVAPEPWARTPRFG